MTVPNAHNSVSGKGAVSLFCVCMELTADLQDWNQCCGILVQCLSGSEKEANKAPFRVQS